MKLLIVTGLQEHEQAIAKILHESGVVVFSSTPTRGFKDVPHPDLTEGWYARAQAHAESVFLFSFTRGDHANEAVNRIRTFNEVQGGAFPVHAFVLSVENSSLANQPSIL